MTLDKQEGEKSTESEGTETGERQDEESVDASGGETRRRYLTLRSVLRFTFQHPPLLFPVVQFQRVLRSKIIGKENTPYSTSARFYGCARKQRAE